ncbi:acyltransferase [Mucilaginibacter sp. CSA2-8R]|uniref:acyltransferase family protein n=1 Tax=Mucilaginibacter sp. CSA2-8R TaxID=3141542 RepID=UPI00315D2E97
MMEQKSSTNHLAYVDSIRALAALYVVIHHMHPYVDKNLSPALFKVFVSPFNYGHQAVDLFIVLSGYLLFLPIVKRPEKAFDIKMFYVKRITRILPPYFAVLIISVLLVNNVFGGPSGVQLTSSPVSLWTILSHVFLIQDIANTSNNVNYVLWSISVEWRIYMFFPFLIWLFRKYNKVIVALSLTTISALAMIAAKAAGWYTSFNGISLHFFGLFALGMLAAQYGFSSNSKGKFLFKKAPFYLLLTLCLVIAFVLNKGTYFGDLSYMVSDVFLGFAVALLMAGLTLGRSRQLLSVLQYKPLATVGLAAYSIYLIHAPVLELINIIVMSKLSINPTMNLAVYYTLGFIAVMLASFLFYKLFEQSSIMLTKKVSKAFDDKTGKIVKPVVLNAK